MAEKPTFVDTVIRGDRPYGIFRKRQELMDKLFINETESAEPETVVNKNVSEKT